jgi:transposase-like protein
MTDKHGARAPEGARKATGGEPASATGEQGRFSSRRKLEAVLRVLRGESLEAVSREMGVTASSLASWRDDFLVGGQANLKSRPTRGMTSWLGCACRVFAPPAAACCG